MDVKVLDASALLAILFREPERAEVAHRLEGARLVAPTLLWFEIVNACVIKIRRHSAIRESILAAFSLQAQFPVEAAEVDHAGALALAEETGLTGYDASYLWLARRLNAELVTLDASLARAATALRSL